MKEIEPKSIRKENVSNFQNPIEKDLLFVEALHQSIVERMIKEDIPVEPNIGELEGLYDKQFNFLGLSGLKELYGDKWPVIAEALKEYLNTEGGKRLRPLLLLNGYRMFSHKEPDQKVLGSAVGLEILHETALFLDDVMDKSTLRRGAPSLWKKINSVSRLDSLDANEVAKNLGSLCFSWSRKLMVDEVEDGIKPEINKIFSQATTEIKQGQENDNELARNPEWPPLEHVLEQFYLKTSSYSMRLPLLHALRISEAVADDNVLEGIETFSRSFGLAFQLHDDLLITKTSEEIGKDSNLDAFNGTKIPIVILARQLGNEQDRIFIDKVWGKPEELIPENITKLQEVLKATGALRKITEMISSEIKKAEAGLDIIAKSGFDVSGLRHLLNVGLPWMDDLAKKIE